MSDESDDDVLLIKPDEPSLIDLTDEATIAINDTSIISLDDTSDLNVYSIDSYQETYFANDIVNLSSYDSVIDSFETHIVSSPVRDSPLNFSIDRTPQNLRELDSGQLSVFPAVYSRSESVEVAPQNNEESKNIKGRRSIDSPKNGFKRKRRKKQQKQKNNNTTVKPINSNNVVLEKNVHNGSISINGNNTLFSHETTAVPAINKLAGLRPIVLDGCNIAFSHGPFVNKKREFSAMGIKICCDFFIERGHEVIAVLPIKYKRNLDNPTNATLLSELEEKGLLTYIPSRKIEGKQFAVYDDIYIVQYAQNKNAVIISRDNYGDLAERDQVWKETISERVVPFTFVGDNLIFPYRPLGPNGPLFEEILRF